VFRLSWRAWRQSLASAVAICALGTSTYAVAAFQPTLSGHPAGQASYVLESVTIDGVTAYPLRDLAPLYAPDLAREVGPGEAVKLAQAITDKYRRDGYFLSRAVVPQQTGEPGQLVLQVYEGYIESVEVTGPARAAVTGLLGDLPRQRPLKLADLERRLTLCRDLPGVTIHSQLVPVLDDPSRHRLVVRTELRSWSGSAYLDNHGTRAIGPWESTLRLAANSVAEPGDQLGVSLVSVPANPRDFVLGEVSYGLGLARGSRLQLALSASRSDVGGAALDNSVGDKSEAADVRLAVPLERTRSRSIWASLAFDARHVEQAFANRAGYADDLRVLRAGLSVDTSAGKSSGTAYLLVSRGLDGLGAGGGPSLTHSRFDADSAFWKVNAGASHYNDIGRRFGFYVAMDGQWAPRPLLLSEQFAPGGAPYGRAFNYSEIEGDKGVAGLAELRFGFDPHVGPLTFFQAYAFFDAAQTWYIPGRFGSGGSASLASTGPGLRLSFGHTILRIEAAKPLTRTPFDTRNRNWRLFGSLSAAF